VVTELAEVGLGVEMKVISLGWGVQSWTLAAMAALGEIEADVAIHADTTWEKSATYDFARQWQPWLENHGLRVAVVGGDNPPVVPRRGGENAYPGAHQHAKRRATAPAMHKSLENPADPPLVVGGT
jgi:3'-phosphoadenosine 5'-phosphosulfate sulfotransferase (PAPS reductase)/FAD synthetase